VKLTPRLPQQCRPSSDPVVEAVSALLLLNIWCKDSYKTSCAIKM
jgi:hypothetical protein